MKKMLKISFRHLAATLTILSGIALLSACATGRSINGNRIESTINEHGEDFKTCYLAMAPTLVAGRVLVHFNIGPDGKVGDADVKSSTFKNAQVGNCIVSAIKKIQFPKPHQNGVEEVIYPFNFSGPKS
jgi:TonB family protein